MDFHRQMKFSTYDRDNEYLSGDSCATSHKGCWWFNHCYEVNFNGQYGDPWDTGICMHDLKENNTILCNITMTTMKIKPSDKTTTVSGQVGKMLSFKAFDGTIIPLA